MITFKKGMFFKLNDSIRIGDTIIYKDTLFLCKKGGKKPTLKFYSNVSKCYFDITTSQDSALSSKLVESDSLFPKALGKLKVSMKEYSSPRCGVYVDVEVTLPKTKTKVTYTESDRGGMPDLRFNLRTMVYEKIDELLKDPTGSEFHELLTKSLRRDIEYKEIYTFFDYLIYDGGLTKLKDYLAKN